MINYLFNFSNIRSGGALQVAQSFLYDLHLNDFKFELNTTLFLVSHEVGSFIEENKIAIRYKVCPNSLFLNFFYITFYALNSKLIFTLFGPFYGYISPKKHVCGFAQPHILYPDNCKISFKNKLLYKIKSLFFRYPATIVVEAEHVKNKLRDLGYSSRLYVVSNCLNSIVQLSSNNKFFFEKQKDLIYCGFPCRDYPHKNIDLLYELAKSSVSNNIKVVTTLSDEELSHRPSDFLDFIINVGPVDIGDVSSFYNHLDFVLFPSNLECFSATLVEAMYFHKPIIASNYLFNRNVCGDQVIYFEPNSISSLQKAINNIIIQKYTYNIKPDFLDSKIRTKKYLQILMDHFNELY